MTRNATRFVTLLVATMLMGVAPTLAGNGGYTSLSYDVTSGSYSAISGGTLHASGSAIGGFATTANLPFTMNWGDNSYSQITVAGSGQMWFGTTASNAVWAWEMGITGASNGELRTTELGTAPNRVFVIQWSNMTRSPQGSSNDRYNFQVRLHENGDVAEVVYGSMNTTALCAPRIGARTSNMTLGLFSSYWYNTWQRPHLMPGSRSLALDGWAPASGLTYQFHNAPSNDAAITVLTSPTGKFDAGETLTVKARITNHGSNELDSVTVYWSIDGNARTPVKYYANPALQPGESVEVQLGTVSFPAYAFSTIVANTSMPNGVNDANPGNDTYQAYMAPRVKGRLNVAQGSGNAGVFPNINSVVRHLYVSGTSDDVNVHVFSGTYNEQVIVPEINGGDLVTFMAAQGAEPVITWQPSNSPSWNIGVERATYQAWVMEDASVKFAGIEFRMPNGLNWGGHVYGDGHRVLMIDHCTFTGVNNFLTQSRPVYAVDADGANTWVMNSIFEKMQYGINIDGGNTDDRVTGNTLTNIGNTGVMVSSGKLNVSENTVSSSNGTDFFVGVYVDGAGMVSNNVISADIASQNNSSATGLAIRSRDNYSSSTDGIDAFNNMVAIGAQSEAAGIAVVPGSMQDATRIYHNSVNITGLAGVNNGSTAFFIGYDFPTGGREADQPKGDQAQGIAVGAFQVVNNIFHNAGTGTNGGYAYVNDLDLESTSDFNNLMTTGRFVGEWDGLPIARNTTGNPLTDWRNTSSGDYNSSSVAVSFVGGADLHLQEIDRALFGSSSTMGQFPVDIDGEDRKIPYMGADEIAPVIRIIEQPISQYACLGGQVTLLCIADVTIGADVTYQWYKDGVKLDGQTGAILTIGSIGYGASGVYSCNVEATDGFNEVSVMSEPATIIVVRNTMIVVQPISQPVAPGGSVTLEVAAEAIGSPIDFEPTYQWKKRYWDVNSNSYQEVNVVDNGRITGSQSSILTIRDIEDSDTADVYVCTVVGYCGEATSKQARLFFPTVAASNNTPNACEGGTILVECSVIPSVVQGSGVEYQWYVNGAALTDGGDIAGARTKVLSISNATQSNAGTYHCMINYTGVSGQIASNDVDVTIGVAPAINTQPEGDTICEGEAASLSVDASGDNISYQWMKGTTEIPGATGMSYDIASATEADAGSYSVIVTNACGDATSVTVDLLVNTAASITTEPTDVAVFDGDTIRFSVEAEGTEPITYQWYFNDAEIDGANEASYEVEAGPFGEEAGEYYCIVTNACGSDTTLVVNADVTVGVAGGEILPGGYTVGNPMPNPTSNVVAFTYAVPSAQNVTITLTNMVGQQIATVVNGLVTSGEHRVEISAQQLNLAPGAYTITFMSKGTTAARQFIVVK